MDVLQQSDLIHILVHIQLVVLSMSPVPLVMVHGLSIIQHVYQYHYRLCSQNWKLESCWFVTKFTRY